MDLFHDLTEKADSDVWIRRADHVKYSYLPLPQSPSLVTNSCSSLPPPRIPLLELQAQLPRHIHI